MSVLICRPEPLASQLQLLLATKHIDAKVWPAISITAPQSNEFEAFCQQVKPDDIIVVVSQFVVSTSLQHCPEDIFKTLHHCCFFAIGAATATALQHVGIEDVHFPQTSDSEHLLALAGLQNVQGKRVWLLRGQHGREHLFNTLQQRGAEVMPVCCYLRQANQDKAGLQALLTPLPQLIILASIDSLKALLQCLSDTEIALLKKTLITSMSASMLELAHKAGFETVLQLKSANNHHLVNWIAGAIHDRSTKTS